MRATRRFHAPAAVAVLVMLILAGVAAVQAPRPLAGMAVPAPPRIPLRLPLEDADHDGYDDALDAADGDVLVAVEVTGLGIDDALVVVQTDQDHWRLGAGRHLAWPHVVDVDPLGPAPGSRAWGDASIRTGAVVRGMPDQVLLINVADDRTPQVHIQVWDRARDPYVLHAGVATAVPLDGARRAVDIGAGSATLWSVVAPGRVDATWIVERWAPTLHFDSGELFLPVAGEDLQAVDGFYRVEPALRTWARDFNGGRDQYRLLADHFNDDGVIDHRDLALRIEGLRDHVRPTVYAHVTYGADLRIIVQYWFLYMHNFVLDERGDEVAQLAHAGDREFIQLVFEDVEAARNGTPTVVAFSQHHAGIVVPWPREGADVVDVWVARGSHASYPHPGDDRRQRPPLRGYHDRFDGEGPTWTRTDYTLEILGDQEWHLAHLWGPVSRYSRDFGTATRPILLHDFRYPFQEPDWWMEDLPAVPWAELEALYGVPP